MPRRRLNSVLNDSFLKAARQQRVGTCHTACPPESSQRPRRRRRLDGRRSVFAVTGPIPGECHSCVPLRTLAGSGCRTSCGASASGRHRGGWRLCCRQRPLCQRCGWGRGGAQVPRLQLLVRQGRRAAQGGDQGPAHLQATGEIQTPVATGSARMVSATAATSSM